jgi:excisionase family DNA binding protein
MGHKQTDPPAKEFLTVGYVAEVIGKCRRTVYRAIKDGKIRAITFGASVMIPADELKRICERGF